MYSSRKRRSHPEARRPALLTVLGLACLGGGFVTTVDAQGRPGQRRDVRPAVATPHRAAPRGTPSTSLRPAIEAVYQSAGAAQSVGELDRALEQCGAIVQRHPSGEDAQYLRQLQGWLLNRRGEAYASAAERAMDGGHEDEAVRLERLAIADFTASTQVDPQWRAFHNRGVSWAMLEKYEEAIASFGEAIELNPTYVHAYFNRAELLLELGRYAQAEQDYARVLQLDAADPAAHIGRGHALFYLTRFEDALAQFDAAIRQQPDHAIAYADRADLHAFMGHWEEAARDYRAAIQLDRQLGRAYQSAAWLMATCPDERYRDAQLALRSAERALELDGSADYRYLDTLAAAQASAGQFPAAAESAQQAIQRAPADVHAELRARLALYQAQRPFRDETR